MGHYMFDYRSAKKDKNGKLRTGKCLIPITVW